MTPKEKAEELVNHFYSRYRNAISYHHAYSWMEAIKSSAFCVDEILKEIPIEKYWNKGTIDCMEGYGDEPSDFEPPSKGNYKFWQEVKQEIEKL